MKNQACIVIFVLLLLVGGACVAMYVGNSEARQFSRAFEQIELGMNEGDVHEIFGRRPDFWCRYRTYRVCYYESPGWFAQSFDDDERPTGETVKSLKDLPDIYDAVQLAFDSKGQLYAYTQIGETYAVETSRGAVEGRTSFVDLDDSDFGP